jgi:SpoVK/Ycf46/Vps4 family AAA+-type ATPase
MAETIKESILDGDPNVHWDDIKGLSEVKKILNETIVLP